MSLVFVLIVLFVAACLAVRWIAGGAQSSKQTWSEGIKDAAKEDAMLVGCVGGGFLLGLGVLVGGGLLLMLAIG